MQVFRYELVSNGIAHAYLPVARSVDLHHVAIHLLGHLAELAEYGLRVAEGLQLQRAGSQL